MVDVVSTRSVRTYPLPDSVVQEAAQGLRWQQAYGRAVSEPAKWMGGFLASGGSVTADVAGILASIAGTQPDRSAWGRPSDEDWPNGCRVEAAMMGGAPLLRWLSKVLESARREDEAAVTAALERAGYDERYDYIGVADSADSRVVRRLVRVGDNSAGWEQMERDGSWTAVAASGIQRYRAYELDRPLVAAVVAALSETDGLMLRFETPVAWLPWEPVVAAADTESAHYYAVVDPSDSTAVMDVISIAPGPQVCVRQDGKWVPSDDELQKLESVSPPPLVELSPEQLKMVLAQVDGTVTQAENDPDYVESLGNEDGIQAKQAQDEADKQAEYERRRANANASGSVTAALAQSLADARAAGNGLHAAALRGLLSAAGELRTRHAALETVTRAPLVSAASLPGRRDSVRQIWIRGTGPIIVKWGCTLEEAS